MMATLDLSVPEQHGYTDPTVELDPVRLDRWLSDLPLMNVVETVRLVSGALDALNEQRLAPEQRFRCLEVYRPTVRRLFETVDPLNIRLLSMSRGQRQETITSAARLFNSLASGFKLTVLATQGQEGELAGQTFNRAIEALGYVLLDCYRYYRAVPAWLVAELHQLYRETRRQGMLDVRLPGNAGETGRSTATLYKFCLLLSLTDPERLVEGEISQLAEVLREHADRSRVLPGGGWAGDGSGLFLLDLAGDALPRSCVGLSSAVGAEAPFLFDTKGLSQALQERLEAIPETIRLRSPEARVVERLQSAGHGISRRREQRHRNECWIRLIIGLEGIHDYLQQQDDGQKYDCQVLDSSAGGMKLFVEAAVAGDARVGDLFGILEGEAGQEALRLGCVRSLQVLQQGGMESGVQMIAGGVGAVSCSDPDQPDTDAVPALFLPADEENDIAASLIVTAGLYQEGHRLSIDVGGRSIQVRVGRRIADGPVFDRFEFAAE